MIDELVEQSLEQNAEETRIAEAKARILESIEVEQLSDKIRTKFGQNSDKIRTKFGQEIHIRS